MFNYSGGNHDKEHERLIRQGRTIPLSVTTLPAATTANTGQRISYGNSDYYSDGTRWLSTNLYNYQIVYAPGITFPATATTNNVLRAGAIDDTLSAYVTKITIKANVQTTLDATNNWTLTFRRFDSSGAVTAFTGLNTYQSGRVAGGAYLNTLTLNTVFTPAQAYIWVLSITKNNAPGTVDFEPATLWFRLVAA